MKRVTMLLGLVWAAGISLAHAQSMGEPSSHLSFNGVSIDGTLSGYVSKMEQKGFTKVNSVDGYALLQGDYETYKNCYVAVETLRDKDVVSKIAVMLPPSDTWSDLSSNYFSLKYLLDESYGTPSDQVENFHGVTPVDDDARMEKVKSGKSNYYTTYETPHGSIQLSIERDHKLRCFVRLAYYDGVNGEEM